DAPCIVYIDEIDAVGHRRTEGEGENTLNQLLVEMDGFNKSTSVVVLASTNRVDILDTALLRPGRFDRHMWLGLCHLWKRPAIFEVHLKKLKLAKRARAYSTRLAGLTPGFSGADIVNVVNEAAIVAARSGLSAVDIGCFERAADRVIGGLESGKVITPEERRVVAFHEAGHAVAGWFLEHAHPLVKVTIIPRSSGALGYSQYLPRESALRTRAQLLDVLATTLAGRASEQVNLGAVSTGASNDLAQVTRQAYDMVTVHGMGEEVGQVAFDPGHGAGGRGHYSDHTAHLIDVEVKRVVDEAYQRALDTVTEYNDRVGALAELLLRSETATHDDLVAVLGARPFASHRAYEDFLTAALGAADDDDDDDDDGDGDTDARGVSPAYRWGALAWAPTCPSRARARAPARPTEPEEAGSEAGQG
ncbi:peptidase family M41-domain-containing protein, partial [Tribonema minus]